MSKEINSPNSPLDGEVKDVPTLNSHLKDTGGENFNEDDFGGLPLGHKIEASNKHISQEELPEDEPEPAPTSDWGDRHSLQLGEAAFEFFAIAAKEFAHARCKIQEKKYRLLETSPDVPQELREEFREMGIANTIREHNVKNKELLGFNPAEMKEGKELANILFEKYNTQLNLGPEGKMALLFGKAGWRNFNVIQDEIKESNAAITAKIEDAVARVMDRHNASIAKQKNIEVEQSAQSNRISELERYMEEMRPQETSKSESSLKISKPPRKKPNKKQPSPKPTGRPSKKKPIEEVSASEKTE